MLWGRLYFFVGGKLAVVSKNCLVLLYIYSTRKTEMGRKNNKFKHNILQIKEKYSLTQKLAYGKKNKIIRVRYEEVTFN